MKSAIVALALAVAGCTDFPHPSELEHPQIIGLRADPPALAPGERSRLDLLVAGPDGPMTPAVTWSVAGDGRIELEDGTAYLVGGAEGALSVEATALIDGRALAARKSVRITGEGATNPIVTELLVAGQPVADGDRISLPAAATVGLSLAVSPPPDEDALVSWYTTAGEIDRYRVPAPELLTAPEPGTGWLIVVHRDGRGGTCWRSVELSIEPSGDLP